ncbi:MAG: hypothetical protein ACI9JN_001187 [Bacteroidia bacterium]
MDKQNNISEFDQLFKQSFEGASSPVPPGVWEGVSSVTTGAGAAGASSASFLSKLIGIKGAAIIGSVAVLVTTVVVLTNSFKASKEVTLTEEKVEQTVAEQSLTTVDEGIETKSSATIPVEKDKQIVEQVTIASETVDANGHNGAVEPDVIVNNIDNKSIDEKNTDPVTPVKVNVNLIASGDMACVHQTVNFSIQSNLPLTEIRWYLNGKNVVGHTQFMSFMFDEAQRNTILVKGETKDGQKFEASHAVHVNQANADFTVTQKEGHVELTASRALKSNQWFANQALIKENQRVVQFTPVSDQMTIVHVLTDLNGCVDTAREVVTKSLDCDINLFVPNIFTPYDQDGYNADFEIRLPPVEGYRLTIYNLKDAKVVFDTDDQGQKWNGRYENVGTLVPAGYYSYRLVYECNGKTTTKQDRVMVSEGKK